MTRYLNGYVNTHNLEKCDTHPYIFVLVALLASRNEGAVTPAKLLVVTNRDSKDRLQSVTAHETIGMVGGSIGEELINEKVSSTLNDKSAKWRQEHVWIICNALIHTLSASLPENCQVPVCFVVVDPIQLFVESCELIESNILDVSRIVTMNGIRIFFFIAYKI
jgi:hypothetical protein